MSPSHGSTAVTLHFKERHSGRQPLYRPAALRRNGSVSRELFNHPSPPHSPSLAATESKSQSWLSTLAAPFSPSNPDASKQLDASCVRGRMLPRSQWKRDEDSEQCADPDCSQRFDLLNRRHHCRTCGDIFCASHSSRSTFLWPAPGDDAVPAFTPRGTPRATPRSSAVDLPSLVYSVSPSNASAISTASSNNSSNASSTPTSSPPNHPTLMPLSARVCDRCYFSVPDPQGVGAPLLTPPVLPQSHLPAFAAFASASSRPMTLRHPHGSRASSRSRASSPGHSPPGSKSRSRQGSATSASSTTPSEYSTPSTSVERLPYASSSSSAGTSPEELCFVPARAQSQPRRKSSLSRASSASRGAVAARGSSLPRLQRQPLRSTAVTTPRPVQEAVPSSDDDSDALTEVEGDDSAAPRAHDFAAGPAGDGDEGEDEDDERRHDETIRERRRLQQEFGSVQGGPWQSWATF
ncbi:FYVE zinc finger domain-containing protein [Rhodotorula paludigena]|uniref:FYVE zinc finger domain-containing protein n=1 Tax=Rhodotorula paludigena TaxID=86838 RepID=UPI003175A9E7